MTISKITTHVSDALGRMLEQFKGKTAFETWVTVFVERVQVIEDAFWDLFTNRWLDNAAGKNLEVLGAIVGQPRNGVSDDETYRRYIRARIITNRSNGVIEDLLQICRLVVNDTSVKHRLAQQFPMSIRIREELAPTPTALADILIGFLIEAVGGGVRILLETAIDEPSEMFTFASAAFLAGTEGAGSTELVLKSPGAPAAWPATGSLLIEVAVTGKEETVTYTQISTDRLTVTCSSTSNSHGEDACVQLSGGPGKGFDDTASPGAGGKFADVRSN